ncbi:polysaccharide pyruvyl transferase family protein [Marinilabilia sp.]|uniref:polysaccharide pyruvyl transferase family protein n=1 Tax=Marinilabilia sp. TaxID=2021252 RepID=UPI0025C6ABCC|nr:polysaccharide pyruvyl transferase family protein [Marinilabilia sp.]
MVVRIQKYRKLSYFAGIELDPKQKYAFFFLAADYGNLGDVAITFAQKKFIQENSVFRVIEIPISKSPEGLWFVSRNIKTDDIVTTVGGGNMGDLYDQIEYIRQLVVKFFPDNRIISFPQTFHFSETSKGQMALRCACEVYNSHKDLHIFARENVSYQLMKKYLKKATIYLTPDIVFSLGQESSQKKRNGAVFCLRNDKEKKLSEKQFMFLNEKVKARFEKVSFHDTDINNDSIGLQEQEYELKKLLDVFRSAELVVTDRLHGMIFCYITNTPCLVLQNNNHKILGSYQWIKDDSGIELLTEIIEEGIIEKINSLKPEVKTNSNMIEKFKSINNLLY